MTKAIRINAHGGPDVLSWEEIDLPRPGPGQVGLRHTAIGLNYIDIYHRSGLYPLPLPSGLGLEAAGVIDAVGDGVTGFSVGDRVCYGNGPIGAYAEARILPAATLLKIPAAISDTQAAAMMLQGMTAQYLVRRTFPVEPGMSVLVHAAAGGVGLILCQWLNHLGANVIGTVGTDAKASIAQAHGCHNPIVTSRQDFVTRVKALTGGKGVAVVYDGVGKDVFLPSLDCLAPRGMMVTFGNASGPVPPFDPLLLSQKGSLFLTRPTLFHYTSTRPELEATAQELFDLVQSGVITIKVHQTYALEDAAQAHMDLESRKTTGSSVLVP